MRVFAQAPLSVTELGTRKMRREAGNLNLKMYETKDNDLGIHLFANMALFMGPNCSF